VPASILIIADRVEIATLIARCLASSGHRPLVANDVRHAGLILEREKPEAVVLDLVTPGHADGVVHWLRADPKRAAMALVRVNGRLRHGAGARFDRGTEIQVPKPFTPRQIVDAVRTALMRRAARERLNMPSRPAAVTRVQA
jgi:DNA-binding response OmpR family regulator